MITSSEGAGMVMRCEPLANAIDELQADTKYDEIIYVTPDGQQYNQQHANTLSLKEKYLSFAGITKELTRESATYMSRRNFPSVILY